MAEVKLSLPANTPTMTYNKGLSTAGLTLRNQAVSYVSKTDVDSHVPVAVMSYEPKQRVVTEGDLDTRVNATIVTEGDTFANADPTLFPRAITIEADTNRRVSNSTEAEGDTHSVITAQSITIEGDVHSVVSQSVEIEGDTERQVKVRVTVEASTCRTIVTDDEEVDPEGAPNDAFVDKNTLFRVQHDVLNEDLTDNPYFDKLQCSLKNAALLTRSKSIIKAINELFLAHKSHYNTSINMMRRFDSVIGNLAMDPKLREKYKKLNVKNVISALVAFNDSLSIIQTTLGSGPVYDKTGYNYIIDAIADLKDKINKTYHYWEGKTEEELDEVFTNLFGLTSYKNGIERRIEALESAIGQSDGGTAEDIERVRSEFRQALSELNTNLSNRIDGITILTEERVNEIATEVVNGNIEPLSRELQEVSNKANESAEQLGTAITEINTLKDVIDALPKVTEQRVTDIVESYVGLQLTPINQSLSDLDTLTDQMKNQIEAMINGINQLTETVNGIPRITEDRVLQIVNGVVDPVKQDLDEVSAQATLTADNLESLTNSFNSLVQDFTTYTGNTNVIINDLDSRVSRLENMYIAVTDEAFNEFKEEVREDIRQILSALDGSSESGEQVSQVLLEYLHTEVDPLKQQSSDLDNRVKALEDRINLPTGDVFTTNDICSEEDIREMFNQIDPGPDIDPISESDLESLIMTEEEVREMFNNQSGGAGEDTVSGGGSDLDDPDDTVTGGAGAGSGEDSGDGPSLDGDDTIQGGGTSDVGAGEDTVSGGGTDLDDLDDTVPGGSAGAGSGVDSGDGSDLDDPGTGEGTSAIVGGGDSMIEGEEN